MYLWHEGLGRIVREGYTATGGEEARKPELLIRWSRVDKYRQN